jgi:hypothetical protein
MKIFLTKDFMGNDGPKIKAESLHHALEYLKLLKGDFRIIGEQVNVYFD